MSSLNVDLLCSSIVQSLPDFLEGPSPWVGSASIHHPRNTFPLCLIAVLSSSVGKIPCWICLVSFFCIFSGHGMAQGLFDSWLDAPLAGNRDAILFAKQSMEHSLRPQKLSLNPFNTPYHPEFDMTDMHFVHLSKNTYWAPAMCLGGCWVIS